MVNTQHDVIVLSSSILKKYPVKRAALFGSFVRNEQTSVSDVDLLLDLGTDNLHPKAYYIYELLDELEVLLGRKIDCITVNGLRQRPFDKLEQSIKEEGLWFYET